MAERTRRREPILAETGTKRQHFVPRFLLEKFTGCDSQIQRLDLISGSIIKTNTINTAVDCGFYDVDLHGQKLSAESWLSDAVEGPVVDVIRNLATAPESLRDLTKVEQWYLARFLVAQRFRVPAFRKMIEEKIGGVEEAIARAISAAMDRQVSRADLPELVQGIDRPVVSVGADASLSMLGEVDGFANLVLYKEWRIGRVCGERRLYTSDNAVAAYLTPVRPWWSGGAFAEHQYYFPLSPEVMLWVAGEDYSSDVDVSKLDPFGPRTHRDFTEWEVSFARHVISDSAERYLFGTGPYIEKGAAEQYLGSFGRAQIEFAMRYQGYDPRQPRNPELDALLAKRNAN